MSPGACRRVFFALLGVLLLVGCETIQEALPGEDAPALSNPRPVGSPDVVVISFSGRCTSLNLSCVPPFDNHTYLEEPSNLARQAVGAAFESLGLTVGYADVSAFVREHYSYVSGTHEPGYADAAAALERIQREWIADFDNPTRLVLLAHSHGTVWASLLAWNHPNIAFDYFIYLDGICSLWEADNLINQPLVQDYYAGLGRLTPWPINQTGGVCDLSYTSLSGAWDINDLVPWNVTYALEVRSKNGVPNYVWDDDMNVRADGSRDFISTIEQFGETHSDVAKAGSAAMFWVTNMIDTLGLPTVELTSQAAPNPASMPRVPAPPGYRYAD